MKKAFAVLAVILVLGVALLAGLSSDGWRLFGVGLDWSPERAYLKKLAFGFLEDLQYKGFDRAARYHTWEDQKKVEIPKLIERLFQVKPEQLNIHNIKVTKIDFDERGQRARTFFKCSLEMLNSANNPREGDQNKTREVEGILYWHKLPASLAWPPPGDEAAAQDAKQAPPPPSLQADHGEGDERWFMRLESSLH